MKNGFRFTSEKKIVPIVVLSSICAFSMVSCQTSKYVDYGTTKKSDETTTSIYTESEIGTSENTISSSSNSSTLNTTQTDVSESTVETTYVDGIGEVFVNNVNYLSKNDFVALRDKLYDYGFISLGVDNPAILEQARIYFNNDSLTLNDIGYFQSEEIGDSDTDIIDTYGEIRMLQEQGYYMDFARYVKVLESECVMTKQISNEFFKNYFHDYWQLCQQGKLNDFLNKLNYSKYCLQIRGGLQTEGVSALDKFLSKNIDEPEAHEDVKACIFMELCDYNQCWFNLASTYSNYISFMPITETTDHEFVIVPSSASYKKLQDIVSAAPHCENLDISKPETYEDLVNSGVNIDLIERAFDYAGLDIPKLSQIHDQENDQQRSRG